MATLIFYKRISYSRGWSCVSQHLHNINKPFFNARWQAFLVNILWSQGAFPPGFYLLREGWVYCPTPEAPQKRNADGAEGIFGTCQMYVGYGPAPGPTIKRPCAILARSVGRALNIASSWQAFLVNILRSQGPSPQAFTSFGRVGFIARRLRRPKKGNADGAEGIFGTCRMRVGYGPAPGPTIQRPCAILARLVGRATNTASSWQSSFKEESCILCGSIHLTFRRWSHFSW